MLIHYQHRTIEKKEEIGAAKKKSVTGCRFDFILEGLVSFIPEGILHVGKNNTICILFNAQIVYLLNLF